MENKTKQINTSSSSYHPCRCRFSAMRCYNSCQVAALADEVGIIQASFLLPPCKAASLTRETFTKATCLQSPCASQSSFVFLPPWYRAYVFNVNAPSSIETICLLKESTLLWSPPAFLHGESSLPIPQIWEGGGVWGPRFQTRAFGDFGDLCKRNGRCSCEFRGKPRNWELVMGSSQCWAAQRAGGRKTHS